MVPVRNSDIIYYVWEVIAQIFNILETRTNKHADAVFIYKYFTSHIADTKKFNNNHKPIYYIFESNIFLFFLVVDWPNFQFFQSRNL